MNKGESIDAAMAVPQGGNWRRIVPWLSGTLLLVGLIAVALRFGELEEFLRLARSARPSWLLTALAFQVGTYLATAAVWQLGMRRAGCFELATNVSLVIGTAVMIPTVWSGWRSWKPTCRGAATVLFQRKIAIAFALLVLSLALSVWRFATAGWFAEDPGNRSHWVYAAGNTLPIVGALAEGYCGGRLNHH